MKTYRKPSQITDLREHGRIILAYGEVTGHCHEIIENIGAMGCAQAAVDAVNDAAWNSTPETMPAAQFFEEPSGRRVLFVMRSCILHHDEHGRIALDPANPIQVRQGDVLLNPIGDGAWEVVRQREYSPEAIRQVAD